MNDEFNCCDSDLAGKSSLTWHDPRDVEAFRRKYRFDPDVIRRLHHGLYQGHWDWDLLLAKFPPTVSAAVRCEFELNSVELSESRSSSQDGSTKMLFRLRDGELVESVLMRAATGRTSVCISSQVGCRAACPFCATARMGLRRQLTAAEILDQILVAAQLAKQEGRRLRNVVFMGMGEPLDNEPALYAVLERLLETRHGMAMTPRRVLVSTVGVPDAMRRLSERYPGLHMALSLHSAKPELRSRLVPWGRRCDWNELRSALQFVAERHNTHRHQGPVMIEHLLAAGINDSEDDSAALIDYLQGIRAHVNLIPYNPVPGGPPWQPSPRHVREVFANRLRDAGIFTTIRYSMGADIQAACGQLVILNSQR